MSLGLLGRWVDASLLEVRLRHVELGMDGLGSAVQSGARQLYLTVVGGHAAQACFGRYAGRFAKRKRSERKG